MEDIKKIHLNEKDFQLIIDGLEHLPSKGEHGAMLAEIFVETMAGDTKLKAELTKRHEEMSRKRDLERKQLKEDVIILQGKLLMLKRFLTENNLMDQVSDFLK